MDSPFRKIFLVYNRPQQKEETHVQFQGQARPAQRGQEHLQDDPDPRYDREGLCALADPHRSPGRLLGVRVPQGQRRAPRPQPQRRRPHLRSKP